MRIMRAVPENHRNNPPLIKHYIIHFTTPYFTRLTYLSVLPLMDDAGTLGTLIQNKYKYVPENRYNKEGYAQVSGTIS